MTGGSITEGISQGTQNGSCGYYHMQEPVLPMCRAGPAGGV